MNNKIKILLVLIVFMLLLVFPTFANGSKEGNDAQNEEVTKIVYWQYFYETKKNLMDELIKDFESKNPDIKVIQQTFPYENYNTKVASSVPSGKGPNVINLYYGWLPNYIKSGYLQSLPKDMVDYKKIEEEFLPLVDAAKFDGKYYALPTAVRSLALFWNKDLFKEAGLDPENPPKTFEELVDYAKVLTKKDAGGNYLQTGITLELRAQVHHWIREILIRQCGGAPYSEDGKTVTYNNEAGYEALKLLTDLQLVDEVGMPNFMTNDVTAFKSGLMGMTIDGSYRLGTLDKIPELKYGVTEIPTLNGKKYNFASFWANGITKFTKGKELEASIKFLNYLTSEEVMDKWLNAIGELPAKKALVSDLKYSENPKYGPFIKGLSYANATKFIDEASQRQVWIDAWDEIVLNNVSVKDAVDSAASKEQKILDKYYK